MILMILRLKEFCVHQYDDDAATCASLLAGPGAGTMLGGGAGQQLTMWSVARCPGSVSTNTSAWQLSPWASTPAGCTTGANRTHTSYSM